MEQEIIAKLKIESNFRERRFREKYLAQLVLQSINFGRVNDMPLTIEELTEFAHAFNSYDRIWRKVLRENTELRGTDYDTKIIVEQEKQIELGFSPNYHEDIKKLKTLL